MAKQGSRSLRTAVLMCGFSPQDAVGAERVKSVLIPALKKLHTQLRVDACCASDKKNSKSLASIFPGAQIYRDANALLSDQQPQVAVVAGDGAHRYDVCMSAIRAGAHVYGVFGGRSRAVDDLDLAQLARSHNVLTGCGYQHHHLPTIRQARDLVGKGYLGQLLFFSMSVFDGSAADAADDDQQGGLFARSVARLSWITGLDAAAVSAFDGAVNPVAASSGNRRRQQSRSLPEAGSYFLRLADGTQGALQVCGACPSGSGERLELYGTEGMLMLTRPAHQPFAYHLTGTRVDVGDILKRATPPEKLKRKFRPLKIPRSASPIAAIHMNKPWYGDALALAAFVKAVRAGSAYAPDLLARYKLGSVKAAADRAVSAGTWSPVDYGEAVVGEQTGETR